MRLSFPLLLGAVGLLARPSSGIAKSYFYNFGEEAGDTRLAAQDEISSPEVSLRAPVVFFGQIYNTLFVNSNGFISFLTEIPSFFNVQFPLDYPIVAPFYSDVDAREAGDIWYRETSDPYTVSRVKTTLQEYFSTAADFHPTGVFIATWDGVGPYNQRSDKVNTYQLVLVTDSEDSYAMFHYADGGIQWLQGDGKNPSLPDARGQAGFMSGDGRFFLLEGSGLDQVRSLDKRSNSGSPGVWLFRIGQMTVADNIQVPDLNVEEQQEGGGLLDWFGQFGDTPESCATGGAVCHSNGICTDYVNGFCCNCEQGYFGNGINCLEEEKPLRVTGKVTGNINGVDIEDSDLHAYVLTSEGRSYTALSRISDQIGYDIQSVTAIGTGIAWLFAKPIEDVPNGFTLTGGKMNRTVEINFPQTSHNLVVQQQFQGLDVFNYVGVKTQVTGSVPTVPFGSKIEMDAFSEEYTRVKPGQLRARSSRVFRLKGQTIDTPFTVETLVDYDECTSRPPNSPGQETLRLKVAENIFIQYDEQEQIVRYALSAKVAPLEEVDPCVEGRQECGENSQCVVDGDNFRCICERGYNEVYDSTLNKGICLDINECDTGRDNCHQSATCVNIPGSFTCSCEPGFTGDGVVCEELGTCAGVPCDPNALCQVVSGTPLCVCASGFTGDGLKCIRETETPVIVEQRNCVDAIDICSPYAECIYDDNVRSFRCMCSIGYSGDGETCISVTQQESCLTAQNCSPYGICTGNADDAYCVCLPGYIGDGYRCEVDTSTLPPEQPDQPYRPYQPPYQPYPPTQQPPYQPYPPTQQPPYQPPEPQQPEQPLLPQEGLEPDCFDSVCYCPTGYIHDYNINKCLPDQTSSGVQPYCGAAKCTCPDGYTYNQALHSCDAQVGGWSEARPLPECFNGQCFCATGYSYSYTHHDCQPNAATDYNYNIHGGGQTRVPCNEINTCHPNAQCIYESYSQKYVCQCNAGYDGDGYQCSKVDVSCDELNICHIHAQCLYDDTTLKHVCVCGPGYQGSGLVCTPLDECSSVADCDPNAQCLYDGSSQRYRCACNTGFTGDGQICSPVREAGCNIVNNCDVNADCIYDTYAFEYRCQCRDGFEGDGTYCTATQIGCNVVNNCGENAECSYDQSARGYRCKCQQGFEGDGFFCQSSTSCREDSSVCHPQARCDPDPTSSFGVSCRCLSGFTGDGYDCIEAPNHEHNLLLMNQGLAIFRMPLDANGGPGYIIHFETFMTAVGADIDCLAGRYYWTDVRSGSIHSSKYDGSDRKPIVSGDIGFPEDIAVDWVAGNIYWTDSTYDTVSVASVDDGRQRVIINESLVNPRGIAIHPGLGLLFWSDWNRLGPKIEVSGMDGSGRRVLLDSDLSLPNSLIVDYDTANLCWADAGTHSIECVGFDGQGRRKVMEGAKYPFGLTLVGQNFYYTDWNDSKVHTVDRYSGLESAARSPPLGGSGKLYGVAAVPPTCPPVSNVCGRNGGGCTSSYLCLPNGRGGRTCACSNEDLQDGACNDLFY